MLTVCAAPATATAAALDIHSAMFAAPDIRFLLTSQQKRRAFLRALCPRLADLLAEHGLTLLAMLPLRAGALFAAKLGVMSADAFAGRPFAVRDTANR